LTSTTVFLMVHFLTWKVLYKFNHSGLESIILSNEMGFLRQFEIKNFNLRHLPTKFELYNYYKILPILCWNVSHRSAVFQWNLKRIPHKKLSSEEEPISGSKLQCCVKLCSHQLLIIFFNSVNQVCRLFSKRPKTIFVIRKSKLCHKESWSTISGFYVARN
jgi:hypothetical protein